MSCGARPMSFGKRRKRRSITQLPSDFATGLYKTFVRTPTSVVSNLVSGKKRRHKRRSNMVSKLYSNLVSVPSYRHGRHYVPVGKRLCKRHHKHHSKLRRLSHKRTKYPKHMYKSSKKMYSPRRNRFGASGPGYSGPVSYPTPTSVNYFGQNEPFINPSSWWYPQGGEPTNLIPETIQPRN